MKTVIMNVLHATVNQPGVIRVEMVVDGANGGAQLFMSKEDANKLFPLESKLKVTFEPIA